MHCTQTNREPFSSALTLVLAVVLCVCAALALSGCTTSTKATRTNDDTQLSVSDKLPYWDSILQKYKKDDAVNQLLLVKYTGESNAITQFYVKDAAQTSGWKLVFEDQSFVGIDGVGEASEDTRYTPAGDFKVLEAFGILENPGTKLNYITVTDTTYACNEDCEYYNTIIDTAKTGHDCQGEHMLGCAPYYNYGVTFNYNPERIYGLGSAFFVHCKGKRTDTDGCIALDEEHMTTVLTMADSGMHIVIGNA